MSLLSKAFHMSRSFALMLSILCSLLVRCPLPAMFSLTLLYLRASLLPSLFASAFSLRRFGSQMLSLFVDPRGRGVLSV
jgi:hypothetical protein